MRELALSLPLRLAPLTAAPIDRLSRALAIVTVVTLSP